MLALITLFLAALLVAVCSIWLYRAMFGAQNYQSSTISKVRRINSKKSGKKQGFFSLKRKSAKKAQSSETRASKARPPFRTVNGGNKVPWGW